MNTNYGPQGNPLMSGLQAGQSMGNLLQKDYLSEAQNMVMSGQDPMRVVQWLTQKDPSKVQELIMFIESRSQSGSGNMGLFGQNFGQQAEQPPQQQGGGLQAGGGGGMMGGMGGNPFASGMNWGQNLGGNLQNIFGGMGGGGGAGAASMSAGASQAGYSPEVLGPWLSGGGGVAGGASQVGAGAANGASSGIGSLTGGASGGGAAGGSGWLASAGPWAALAAAILVNENEAREGGYRDEDDWEYAKDLFGGKVMSDDINYRWSPKLFGDDDYGFGADMEIAGELSSWDFSNAWDKLKNDSTLAKLLKKVF